MHFSVCQDSTGGRLDGRSGLTVNSVCSSPKSYKYDGSCILTADPIFL